MPYSRTCLILAVLTVCLIFPATAQEWKSIDDPTLPKTERMRLSDYDVSIYRNGKWEQLKVDGALVSDYRPGIYDSDTLGTNRTLMGFCMFTDEFRKPVKIRVRRQGLPFNQVSIRPTDYKIRYKRIDDQTIELTLRNPRQKVSVEYDGNREHNLFLIPDIPESSSAKHEDNVLYFGPGEHDAGRIELHSGQTLYVDEGATLYASLSANGANDIRIMGRGIICSSKASHNLSNRKNALSFIHCKNIIVEGVMFRDSPSWTLKFSDCEDILIDNVKQICWMVNSDGIDLCNVRHAEIRNCFLRNYDDNISLKNFTNGGNLYDIRFHDNTLWADRAHNLLVGPESRENLYMKDIHFDKVRILEGREKAYPWLGTCAVMISDNGNFQDVSFTNITIDHIRGGCIFEVDFCTYDKIGKTARNILLKKFRYDGDLPPKSSIRGLDANHEVEGITLKNIYINGKKLTRKNLPDYVETNEFIHDMKVH